MAITKLTGTRAAVKTANPNGSPGNPELLGVFDSGSVRSVFEACTLTADAKGYEATDGLRAVLKIGTIPANSKIVSFQANIGVKASSTADKFIIAKDGGTAGTYTAISTIGSLTAAAGTQAFIFPLTQAVSEVSMPIYLIPYEDGDTDDIATLKSGQQIWASAQFVTAESIT